MVTGTTTRMLWLNSDLISCQRPMATTVWIYLVKWCFFLANHAVCLHLSFRAQLIRWQRAVSIRLVSRKSLGSTRLFVRYSLIGFRGVTIRSIGPRLSIYTLVLTPHGIIIHFMVFVLVNWNSRVYIQDLSVTHFNSRTTRTISLSWQLCLHGPNRFHIVRIRVVCRRSFVDTRVDIGRLFVLIQVSGRHGYRIVVIMGDNSKMFHLSVRLILRAHTFFTIVNFIRANRFEFWAYTCNVVQ